MRKNIRKKDKGDKMNLDPNTTKYLIKSDITADGVVEKPDVVGAIFGQTEGLLGEELDLRDLQKGGRIGRIEVDISSSKGRSEGSVEIPSSLDQVETAILASALETIDRVGPCKANLKVMSIEDVRVTKRSIIVDRAKILLQDMLKDAKDVSINLAESVKEAVQIQEILTYGPEKLPAGPNVENSDAVILVEGRNDVLNLLKAGIKNAIAVEGTNVPKSIQELSKQKTVTAFVDGDRGGELVLRELLQVSEVDFIARAQKGKEVEELTNKQIMKSLRHKVPAEQFVTMYSLENGNKKESPPQPPEPKPEKPPAKQDKKGGRKLLGRKRSEEKEKPPEKAEPKLSDEQQLLKNMFNEISGKSLARIISEANAVIAEMPVKDLAEALKSQKGTQGIKAVVFDGIVTQRLVDLANDIGVGTLAASKVGSITKYPDGLNVLTKADFE
jgi:DNA primase